MPENQQADLTTTGIGCAVNLILGTVFGFAGVWIGYILMPPLPTGGYYGTIGEALLQILLWCVPGFIIGFLSAAFVAGRVARWLSKKSAPK